MSNNEFHHLFKHTNGTYYFQKQGLGKKCLSTKDPDEAKTLRDKILDCYNNQDEKTRTTITGNILKLLPGKEKKPESTEKTKSFLNCIKERKVFETSDKRVFFTKKEAEDHELNIKISTIKTYVEQEIKEIFKKNTPEINNFVENSTYMIINFPEKMERLSKIIKDAASRI
jgi:hypothetical protein